jgi:hypothetical protein
VFALVVFHCDEYLMIKKSDADDNVDEKARKRFFLIAKQLPIELQMVLCNRSCGVAKDIILRRHSEPAFKKITWKFMKWAALLIDVCFALSELI